MAATIVMDNGGSTLKVGFSTDDEPRLIPNYCSKNKSERRRVFIGDQLNECKDFSGLFYILPYQKGYLVNWEVQRQIWDYVFSKSCLNADLSDSNLILSEPQFNFTSIKECMDEILFEEYRVNALCRTTAAQLSFYNYAKETRKRSLCCLVVDCGYSFSHVVPVFDGKVIKKGVKRINVGGKIMTNHLKEILSYRQLHVMDETYVINQVREDCCYASTQFKKDMETSMKRGPENTVARDYVLPDYTNVKRGFLRPVEETWEKYRGNEQLLRMNNERFTIPELLFTPSDIGIPEMGISEAVIESVSSTSLAMHPHFYMNIVLTGGNALIPGFSERIYKDVRSMAPIDFDVEITSPTSPIAYAWQGGVELSKQQDFLENYCVTRSEYEENGRAICNERFDCG